MGGPGDAPVPGGDPNQPTGGELSPREQELEDRVADLQAQLDAATARAATTTTTTAPPAPAAPPERPKVYVDLNAGDHCPKCGDGVLFEIANGDDSVTLRCFNCNTQASHRPSIGHKVVVTTPRETPTGFTVSRAQYAAMNSDEPEEAAARNLSPEAGSGVSPPREEFEGA